MDKMKLNKKLDKNSFETAVKKYKNTQNIKGIDFLKNKRDVLKKILNHFIHNDLKNINSNFYHTIVEKSTENSFRDGKVYEDAFNNGTATLLVQNLFGYFIYNKKWNQIKNADIDEKQEDTETNKSKKYLLILLFSVVFIFGLFVIKYFLQLKNSAEKTPTKTQKPIETNITIADKKKNSKSINLKGIVLNNFKNPVPNAILVFDENYKIQTNNKGIYTLNDKKIIKQILNHNEYNFFIYHSNYDTLFSTINKNLFLKNDSILEDVVVFESILPIKSGNTTIDIQNLTNSGNIHLGTKNIYNEKNK